MALLSPLTSGATNQVGLKCFAILLAVACGVLAQIPPQGPISGPALAWIDSQVQADRLAFYVYKDADSGFNHGFPSGWFPNNSTDLSKLHIDTACVYDSTSPNGCATDTTKLDSTRGTVLRVTFDPLGPAGSGLFVGFQFEEPQGYIVNYEPTTNTYPCTGVYNTPNCPPRGYNLKGATQVCFDVLAIAPTSQSFQVLFGVNNKAYMQNGAQQFLSFTNQWAHQCLDLSAFGLAQSDLQSVHYLFMVEANDVNAPAGGTILLDNIQFLPLPASQMSAVSFPQANQVFGVVHASDALPERVPIPIDQVVANVTTVYESSLATLALLAGGFPSDAQLVANAFVAAVGSDNQGDALPVAQDGSTGLHSGMFSGDLLLYNDQTPGGLQGQVRLPGFSLALMADGTYSNLCGPSHFCLVEDGATGGNNAFAMLALVEAYRQFNDPRYLNAARTIGHWIHGVLLDQRTGSFGGYYAGIGGYADVPVRMLQTGKSIENNADIFKAFSALADIVEEQGLVDEAAMWNMWAKIAGDFVIQMYDPATGHFFAGTAPYGISPSPGIQPEDPTQMPETRNIFPFLDAQTFVTLAMADSALYRNSIDWRAPMQWMLDNFAVSVTTSPAVPGGSQTFQGLNLVETPTAGPNGVAYEFTGQAVVALRFVDRLYNETRFEAQAQNLLQQIQHAQKSAPFGNGQGLVAAVMDQGDALPPYQQCVTTPFQCIAERVGLAATEWATFAELNLNPFNPIPAANSPQPQIIVDAAAFQPGLSPGALFSILGTNLATTQQQAGSPPLPTTLGELNVTINGSLVPLLYVAPDQINGQIPYETATGTASLQITGDSASSGPLSFTLNSVAPRVFVGQENACIAQNEDGTFNSSGSPAKAGHYIVAYLTGLGTVNPPIATGAAAPTNPFSYPPGPASVTLGSESIQPTYLGMTPESVGVGQANVLIPASFTSGVVSFSVTVGGVTSNACLVAVGNQAVTAAKPTIVGVSPSSGSLAGGTKVTITGSGFLPGLTVTFGTTQAVNAITTVTSTNTINLTTPLGTGTVSVTVTNPDGQSATLANAFTYLNPPPKITSITPATGPSNGGTVVTLAGSGFQSGMTVAFGATPATNIQVSNGGSALATAPPGSGTVSVTVENPDGQSSTLAAAFTYQASPAISSVMPNPVNFAGGTTITITGSGFVNGLTVMFGSTMALASTVQVLSSNSVQVVTPASPVGTVAITIINPNGQTAAFNGFSFAAPDAIHAIVSAQIQACSVGGSVTQAVIPDAFKIVIYALTNQYYVQPCTTQVLNPINPDGSWGPVSSHSGTIYVLLVSSSYSPPATTLFLPSVDGVNVFAMTGPVGTLVSCDVSACPAQ
jgi:uncharacterized protein (TIGR03437 family)